MHLPTDTYEPIEGAANYMLNHIWDGIINVKNTIFPTKTDSPIPQWATWDLGQTIILSRIKLWHRDLNQWKSDTVSKPGKSSLKLATTGFCT